MSSKREWGIGILGLGFMGRTHINAWAEAARLGQPNSLVAVCDADQQRLTGSTEAAGNMGPGTEGGQLFDPEAVSTYSDPAEFFADPQVEIVSICTHTNSHVELACAALEAGCHVLVEKPVALIPAEVQRLADACEASERVCMPAMCLRFWPGWAWLRERIADGAFGPVRSAVFRRVSAQPDWSAGFYRSPEQSGGALFDLHVHDADFVRWCFGPPDGVTSTGTVDHLTTLYRFAKGPDHVTAEGGWDHTVGFGFSMGYTVIFEQATAVFLSGAEPELTLIRGGESEEVELPGHDGYTGETVHLLEALNGNRAPVPTLEEAVALTTMIQAERASLASWQR